jgi:hypothetical protein
VLTIPQGTTCAITGRDIRIDGQSVDITGWTIHAVLRRNHTYGPIIATWRNAPGVGEGLAEVAAADLGIDPTADPSEKWLYLRILPAMSRAWVMARGVVHAEAAEPSGNQRVARIIDELVRLDPEAVI